MKSRKNSKKKYSRALKVRGGFAPAASFGARMKQQADSMVRQEVGRLARKAGELGMEQISRVIMNAKIPETYKVGAKTIAGTVYKVATDHLTGSGTTEPFLETDSTSAGSSSANTGNLSQQTYHTKFEVGQPSKRVVKQIARQNGSAKQTIINTITDSSYKPETASRDFLRIRAGFNQKVMALPIIAHPAWDDMYLKYNLANLSDPSTKKQIVYGMSMNVGSEAHIMNTGKFFKTKVCIKLYACSNHDVSMSAVWNSSFSSAAQLVSNEQAPGAIPIIYQFANGIGSSSSTIMRQELVDPAVSLASAPNWTKDFEFVRSFTKTLAPNELWKFKMKHHLGSGLNLNVLKTFGALGDRPVSYVMVIEAQGYPCVAEYGGNDPENFIGTSPVFLQAEFKTTHEYALSSTAAAGDQGEFLNPTSGGGVNIQWPAVRSFAIRENESRDIADKKYNVSLSNISGAPTTAGGQIYIPVMTDKVVDYAGKGQGDS